MADARRERTRIDTVGLLPFDGLVFWRPPRASANRQIAGLFAEALNGPFRGVFAGVVFAIVDWSAEKGFFGPVGEVLGGRSPVWS